MIKLSYEQVLLEVEKLYQVKFNDDEVEAINKHCNFISTYIEACGWDVDEFMEQYIHRGLLETSN